MTGRWAAKALLLAVPVAYFVVLGRGHLREIDALQLGVDGCYQQTRVAERQLAHVAALQDDAEWCASALGRLRRLTVVSGASSVLLAATTAAGRIGLDTGQAEIVTSESSSPLASQSIRLRVSGPFAAVFQLIQELEASTPPVRVTAFAVQSTATETGVQADLSLVRYSNTERDT